MMMAWLLTMTLSGAARAECPSDGTAIDVVTLNAWGLPPPIAPPRAGRLDRMAGWLQGSGIDVAGLQEMWWGTRGLFSVDGLHWPGGDDDSGLALVTPHPVRSSRLEPFEARRGVDAVKRKGVVRTVVQVPGVGLVEVWNTHLQAGGTERNARTRAQQVDQLLQGDDGGRPVVLLGDLNLYRDSATDQESREALARAGFLDAAAEAGATQGTYVGLDERFDRILVRGGRAGCAVVTDAEVVRWRRAMGDDLRPSDHRPVWASVQFSAE